MQFEVFEIEGIQFVFFAQVILCCLLASQIIFNQTSLPGMATKNMTTPKDVNF